MTVEMVMLFGTAMLVVFVPGIVIGLAASLRGWLLVGAAPVLTLGVIGVFAPVLPKIGIGWSPLAFLAVSILLAGLVAGARMVVLRVRLLEPGPEASARPPWQLMHHLGVGAAVLGAAGVGLLATKRATRNLEAVPQWFDSSHHANAVRFIADTGDSSPSALKVLSQPEATDYFYPNGYYVLCATIRQIGNFTVVHTLDLVNGLIIGLFSLAMVILVKVTTGSPALSAAAGVLACMVTTFPYDVIVWGPIFPFALGLAVVPAFLALFVHALTGRDTGVIFAAAVGFVGLLGVHSSLAITAVLLGSVYLAQRWLTVRSGLVRDLVPLVLFGGLAAVAGISQILSILGGAVNLGNTTWPADLLPADSFGRLIAPSRSSGAPQWWFTALLVIGLIGLHREKFQPLYWWIAGGFCFGVLYVMDASYAYDFVHLLTGPWWNDSWRVAAIATPGLIALAAVGVITARDALVGLAGRVGGVAALAGTLVILGLLTNGFYLNRNTERLRALYPDGPVVTTEKLHAINWLAGRVPTDVVVANDPFDGSPWMWAVGGLKPLFGSALTGPLRPGPDGRNDRAVVLESLNKLDTDPVVRDAVRRLNIGYVFVSKGWVFDDLSTPAGLKGLAAVRGLREIYSSPTVQIYQVS